MAITLSSAFSTALASHSGTSLADQIGGGSLVIYSGTHPDGANEALTQYGAATVLATFTIAAAATLGSATAGVLPLQFSGYSSGSAVNPTNVASATGTASFFRILSSGAASLIQGLVATGSSDFNLSSTSITSGDNVSITGTPSITVPVT